MNQEENKGIPQSTPASDAAPAPGHRVITFITQTPEGERQVFRLHKQRVVVGSVVSADVRLNGIGVSPIHAVLELDEKGGGTIYDLASETGVYVNGMNSVTQKIKSGDKIKIGGFELNFNVDELADIARRERSRETTEGRKLFLNPGEDLAPLLLEDERQVQQIFDYRPAQKRALEVVMSWHGTILDVEHFVDQKSVTIGPSRKCDFGIPGILGASGFTFVSHSRESFDLHLDPKMQGVLQRNGKIETLQEIRSSSTGVAAVPFRTDDFAKITVGEIDFYLSFTAAPPRLKVGRLVERDPLLIKIVATSAILSAAVIGTLANINVPPSLEAEKIPDRLATILYQPEKYQPKPHEYTPPQKPEPVKQEVKPVVKVVPKPKEPTPQKTVKIEIKPHLQEPKPVPKEMMVPQKPAVKPAPIKIVNAKAGGPSHSQSAAKEGEGAKAKGAEGSRGAKSATPDQTHQTAAMRPSAQGGQGRGGGSSQVQDEGNVDFLKSATGKIENILGNAGANLGKGGEKLKGFGGFTTQGNGGLALEGGGNGGGGTADTTLGGLGNKGRGGGRVGTGLGAAGSGSGIIGGLARVAIHTGGPEEAVVMGAIDADAVEAALLAHRDEFRLCYEKEINAENPNLAGRVGTTFVIGTTGRVTQAGVESTSLKNANTERCILAVIKRIDFPIPRGAGVVQVSYPFKFSPVGH